MEEKLFEYLDDFSAKQVRASECGGLDVETGDSKKRVSSSLKRLLRKLSNGLTRKLMLHYHK
ncbi:hypothetical protein V1477_006521 [Vespula maculifrons]|uniref:Uncharacterized protein n=1 Tax=Vespula maculifrons TaxID=7453 RepID=A0ABD2CJ31_VESMC